MQDGGCSTVSVCIRLLAGCHFCLHLYRISVWKVKMKMNDLSKERKLTTAGGSRRPGSHWFLASSEALVVGLTFYNSMDPQRTEQNQAILDLLSCTQWVFDQFSVVTSLMIAYSFLETPFKGQKRNPDMDLGDEVNAPWQETNCWPGWDKFAWNSWLHYFERNSWQHYWRKKRRSSLHLEYFQQSACRQSFDGLEN